MSDALATRLEEMVDALNRNTLVLKAQQEALIKMTNEIAGYIAELQKAQALLMQAITRRG